MCCTERAELCLRGESTSIQMITRYVCHIARDFLASALKRVLNRLLVAESIRKEEGSGLAGAPVSPRTLGGGSTPTPPPAATLSANSGTPLMVSPVSSSLSGGDSPHSGSLVINSTGGGSTSNLLTTDSNLSLSPVRRLSNASPVTGSVIAPAQEGGRAMSPPNRALSPLKTGTASSSSLHAAPVAAASAPQDPNDERVVTLKQLTGLFFDGLSSALTILPLSLQQLLQHLIGCLDALPASATEVLSTSTFLVLPLSLLFRLESSQFVRQILANATRPLLCPRCCFCGF
jgi:hypothetical protein